MPLPRCLSVSLFIFIGAITFRDFLAVLIGPVAVPFMVLMMCIGFAFYRNFSKAYYAYDGTAESIAHISSALKFLLWTSAFVPFALYFFEPIIYQMSNNARGLVFEAFRGQSLYPMWYSGLIGLQALCAQFFLLETVRIAEKYLSFIPYTKNSTTFPLMFRILATTLTTTAGLIIIIISIFMIPANEDIAFSDLFLKKVVSLSIIGLAVLAVDSYINVRSIKRTIDTMNGFSRSLCERDYTVNRLPITARCELGELSQNMNVFFETTKSVLSGIGTLVASSNETARILSESMESAEKDVHEMTEGIGTIQEQMTVQDKSVQSTGEAVTRISEGIERFHETIGNQSQLVEQSASAVDEMIRSMSDVADSMSKSEGVIDSLTGAAEKGA